MEKPEYKDNYYEDRINLYDYLQTIWRWKFIIVGIVILSVIAALFMSFRITPVYRVSASLSPGEIEELDKETMKVEVISVDSIENIVSYINGGIYNPKIFTALNIDPFGLQLNAKKPGEAYIINVIYDTTNPAQGEVIMKELLNQIEKSYSWKIKSKIDKLKMMLNKIVFYINKVKLLKTVENKMTRQIKMFDDNTESIMKQRDRLLSESGGGDPVVLLLYSNTIHQNIAYKDILNTTLQMNIEEQGVQQKSLETLESEFSNEFLIMEKLIAKDNMVYEFSEFLSKYDYLLEERPSIKPLLEKLEEAKTKEEAADFELIRVVQEPFTSSKPIEPRRTRMIMISVVLSLFLGFFLALIIDFIKKNKASSNQG